MAHNKYYEEWTEQASCREIGGDEWFPEIGQSPIEAKRICMFSCPVRFECLDYAMRLEQGLSKTLRHGLFGGLSPTARIQYEPEWLAQQEVTAA